MYSNVVILIVLGKVPELCYINSSQYNYRYWEYAYQKHPKALIPHWIYLTAEPDAYTQIILVAAITLSA